MVKKSKSQILLVDTDSTAAETTTRILEGGGFAVTFCDDPTEAVEIAQHRPPHAILVEAREPARDALLFLAKRKKSSSVSRVPVLVSHDGAIEELGLRLKNEGANDTLRRPSDARTLIQKISRVARQRKLKPHDFPKGAFPKADVRTQARILMANEAGFLLESPIRVAPRSRIEIQSTLLDKLACANALFRRTSLTAKPGTPGQFLNEIAAIGLSPATLGRIRKIVREWK